MSKASVIRETTEKMQNLGTYKPEFDDLIARYAEIAEKYKKMSKNVKNIEDITVSSAAGTEKMNPVVRVVLDLRKDLTAMEDRLLLSPKEYYKIFSPEAVDDKDSGIKDILEKIKD